MVRKVNSTQKNIRDFDFLLVILVLFLCVIGVLVVHSATVNDTSTGSLLSTTAKQIIGIGIGFAIMLVLAFIDYHKLLKWSWVLYLLAILTLVYVLVFADAIYGAKRWIYFPGFGTIQPSEFSKPFLLVFLAFVLSKLESKIDKIYVILLYFLCTAPVLYLVLKEPDLSTSIVLILMTVTMLFLAGISYKWVLGVMAALVPFIVLFFIAVYQPGQGILNTFMKPHQIERINAYFFPEQFPGLVYQQNNSVMAIGSGGLFGKGLNNSALDSVKNGNFLSEESCDFIFAVIGEELGFIGAAVIISFIVLIVLRCFIVAGRCVDTGGKCIAGTCGAVIALQSFINIGVALLLIPNTGIPLPFVSAGMSSLLSSFMLIGLVLNVGLHGKEKRRGYFR